MTAVIWKVLHPFKYPGLRVSAMCTRRNGKGGELSSQASKMLYKLPGAVWSYKEPRGKIRTRILAGSRHDLDGNPADIPARFWPRGFFSLGRNPGEIPGSQNLAGILPRILTWFSPGSKKSRRPTSRRDPAANLAVVLTRKQKSRRPKSHLDPTARFSLGINFSAAKIWLGCFRKSCVEAAAQQPK